MRFKNFSNAILEDSQTDSKNWGTDLVMDSKPGGETIAIDALKSIGMKDIKVKKYKMNLFPKKEVEYSVITSDHKESKNENETADDKSIPDWIKKLSTDELKDYINDHDSMTDEVKRAMQKQILLNKTSKASGNGINHKSIFQDMLKQGFKTKKMVLNGFTIIHAILEKNGYLYEFFVDSKPYEKKPYIRMKAVSSARELSKDEVELIRKKASE